MKSYEVFDKFYDKYEKWYERHKIIAENELRALEKIKPQGLGLEVGVGTGYFASRLGIQVGVDPSINMLKIARKRNIEVVAAFGEKLPFKSSIFDFAYLIVTLCFVSNPVRVLNEIYRVLKPKGKLVVGFIPKDSSWGQYYLTKKDSPFYRVAKFYSKREVLDILARCGFKARTFLSTLHFPPEGEPVLEEPKEDDKGGFLIVLAEKISKF